MVRLVVWTCVGCLLATLAGPGAHAQDATESADEASLGAPERAAEGAGAVPAAPPLSTPAYPENEIIGLEEDEPAPKKKRRAPSKTFLWVDGGLGLGLANLKKFDFVNQSLYGEEHQGPTFNLGVGLRLFLFTLGGRFNYAPYSGFSLGTANVELGIRIPMGKVEPFLRAFGGYAWVGNASLGDATGAEINGWTAGAGVGLTVFLITYVSLTASYDMDLLALGVDGLEAALDANVDPNSDAAAEIERRRAEAEKTHFGLQQRIQLSAGLHF